MDLLLRRARLFSNNGPKYIQFADPYVKSVCVTNWGDGEEITVAQAAAVPFSTAVQQNAFWNAFDGSQVTSFDELRYFINVSVIPNQKFKNNTSLTSIGLENIVRLGNEAFYGCTSLSMEVNMPKMNQSGGYDIFRNTKITKIVNLGNTTNIGNYGFARECSMLTEVTLPATITQVGRLQFPYCPNLRKFVCLATTPPTDAGYLFEPNGVYPSGLTIYVPYSADHSILNAYKTTSHWDAFASIMEELNPDGTVPNN